jgi:anti-sigma factor RsiW
MTADPYARLGAVYVLGALDASECLAYEAHLATCRWCRASLAEISAIPPLLAGLDESVFAAPPEAAPTPVPDTLLPRLLQAAGRDRLVAAGSPRVWACSPLPVRLR